MYVWLSGRMNKSVPLCAIIINSLIIGMQSL